MTRIAIDTLYRGYRFRSRLEARWAVFLDALGWPWIYEAEGYALGAGWYLPDFFVSVPSSQSFFWEIKSAPASARDLERARDLCAATGIAVWIADYNQPPLYARDLVLRGYRPQAPNELVIGEFNYDEGAIGVALRAARGARFEFEERDELLTR